MEDTVPMLVALCRGELPLHGHADLLPRDGAALALLPLTMNGLRQQHIVLLAPLGRGSPLPSSATGAALLAPVLAGTRRSGVSGD